jgi:hypothetical protein
MPENLEALSDLEILTAGGQILGKIRAIECLVRSLIATHHDPERLELVWDLLWSGLVRNDADSPLPGYDYGLFEMGRRLGGDVAAAALAQRAVS